MVEKEIKTVSKSKHELLQYERMNIMEKLVLCTLVSTFLKSMFSKKATKIYKIFTIDLTVTTYILSN